MLTNYWLPFFPKLWDESSYPDKLDWNICWASINCQDKKHIAIFFILYKKPIFEVLISLTYLQHSLSVD